MWLTISRLHTSKIALDTVLNSSGVQTPITGKQNDPLQAYEGRLLSTASKYAGLAAVGECPISCYLDRRTLTLLLRADRTSTSNQNVQDVPTISRPAPRAIVRSGQEEAHDGEAGEPPPTAEDGTQSDGGEAVPEADSQSHHIEPAKQPRKRARRA